MTGNRPWEAPNVTNVRSHAPGPEAPSRASEGQPRVRWFTGLAVMAACIGIVVLVLPPARATPEPPRTVEKALRLSALTWRVDYWTLRRRAYCESRFRSSAVNRSSGAAGLLQFLPSTWRTTPYRSLSVFDPYANALAAGWMIRVGRGGEWVCR